MHAHFAPVESTQAYLDALQTYVTQHGRPAALYSDRHGIFTKHDPEDGDPTQFQRALGALEIAGIQALTPQAKGRVERLFQTLQDSQVKALRLAGINDLVSANAFLPSYLAQHNAQFAVPPAEMADAHVAYEGSTEALARICAIHHHRKLSKDLILSFNRQRYIIQTGGQPRYALRGKTITVVVYPGQRIELLADGKILPFKVFDPTVDMTPPVDDKTLNTRVDEVIKHRPAPVRPPSRSQPPMAALPRRAKFRRGPIGPLLNSPLCRTSLPCQTTGHLYFALTPCTSQLVALSRMGCYFAYVNNLLL